jgi:hypothetical protein
MSCFLCVAGECSCPVVVVAVTPVMYTLKLHTTTRIYCDWVLRNFVFFTEFQKLKSYPPFRSGD